MRCLSLMQNLHPLGTRLRATLPHIVASADFPTDRQRKSNQSSPVHNISMHNGLHPLEFAFFRSVPTPSKEMTMFETIEVVMQWIARVALETGMAAEFTGAANWIADEIPLGSLPSLFQMIVG